VAPDQRCPGGEKGWLACPASARCSADFVGAAVANAYLRLPPGARSAPVGAEVAFQWIGGTR